MHCLRWFVPLLLIACGGTQDGGSTTPGGGGGGSNKPAQAGDVSVEVPTFQIKGTIFEPQALGRPGIPTSMPKKKTTIDKQRQAVASAKDPVIKQANAVGLASMIYTEAKTKTGADEKKLMEEARKVIRDVVAAVGNKVDETSLLFLASYEMYFEDWAAAAQAWDALLVKSPKDKDGPYFRTWWAYSLLKQFKNAEALAAVKDEPHDKHPELAYVTAWAKWRTNDDAGAWNAMVAAAKGWTGDRKVIDDELLLFAARSNTPFAQAMPQVFGVFNATKPDQQTDVLIKLGKFYGQASGRWADGVAALEKAITTSGKAMPAQALPVLRYLQADYTVRLDDPEATQKFAKQTIDATAECPQAKCSDKEKQEFVTLVSGIARIFHFIYATSNDVRYYEPANQIYLMTIPIIMDPTLRAERNSDAEKLQRTMKGQKHGTGTHDKDAIKLLAERHNMEIQACYEGALAANPKLGGNLTLMLESDQTGVIKGATTEPKGGAADLAAVATCVVEQARTWKLPKRGMAGNTRITLKYALAPGPRKP